MGKGSGMVFALLLGCVLIFGCAKGDVSQVDRVVGESEIFTSRQIDKAMDAGTRDFHRNFSGCTLLKLEYDETDAQNGQTELDGDTIVINSSFYVDSSGASESLEPNSTYRNFRWTLTRTIWGGWEVRDRGCA